MTRVGSHKQQIKAGRRSAGASGTATRSGAGVGELVGDAGSQCVADLVGRAADRPGYSAGSSQIG